MENFLPRLEQYCKNLSTVIEYFLVIGLTPKNIRDHLENDGDFSPAILSQFPPLNRNEILIPESIPLFCFPSGIIITKIQDFPSVSYLVLTDEKGNKLFCTCLKIWEPCDEIYEDTASTTGSKHSSCFNPEVLYMPKCLIVISRLAFFDTFARILRKLHEMCFTRLRNPLEWYICDMVLSVPTPPRGHLVVNYKLDQATFNFKLPPCNKLPLLDLNLDFLFSSLCLDNVLKVFTCIALEYSMVFLSANEQKLSACSYSLLSFMFPFHWSLVYVPILPDLLLDYLYSPVSYVYGLHPKLKEEIYIRGTENLFIVDLDNNNVQSNPQAMRISGQYTAPETVPLLPTHYGKKLRKKLHDVLNSQKKGACFLEKDCDKIREAFFQFFVSIFRNYKKFMNFNPEHTGSFEEQGFLKSNPENSRDFLKKFIKTQMFANFCETRLRPQNVEEHSENLLFDEHILSKDNRSRLRYSKHPTPFINDDSQLLKNKWDVPDLPHSLEMDPLIYGLFPDLNPEQVSRFPLPKSQPPKYSESMDFPMQGTSAYSQVFQSDKECIYSCWIEMWAACLWYQDEGEHSLRLKELFSALRKLKEISTVSLTPLYKILLEASARINPSLGMPIFSEMTNSHVMVDAATVHLLQRIISLSFKKDQINSVRNVESHNFFTNTSSIECAGPNVHRRRVFTKAGDSHIFAKQELCFLIKETCKKCKKHLNIKEIKEGWQDTPYNFEALCAGCKEKYIPSIRVRIGLEIGHETKTSNRENTIFVSPRSLRALVRDLLDDPKNKFKLEIELFRIYNAVIFWNLIWHFNDSGLPFEFMLPYEQEVVNVNYSFVVVGEEVSAKKKVDKEVQTDWNMINISRAIAKQQKKLAKRKDNL